jgi:hypothetical protein
MVNAGSSMCIPRPTPGKPSDDLAVRCRLGAAAAFVLALLLCGPAAAADQGVADTASVQGTPDPGPSEIAVLPDYSVLTPEGTLVIQPSFEYSHSSVNRVALEGFTIIPAITIGAIDVRRVNRDALIAGLAFRYGLTPRLEVEFELPYVWRRDSAATRPLEVGFTEDKITNIEGSGFGDLEARLRYQVNRGADDWSFIVTDLRIKSDTGRGPFDVSVDPVTGLQRELPTGSGFWAIEPGVTAIFPSDPAVFFARGSYMWTIGRETGSFGRIDPGDVLGFSFGMGFAINEKASFSLGYDHSIVGKTTQDGGDVPGSEVMHLGSLLLGASFRHDRNRTFHISLAAGLTDDATDVRINLRYPIVVESRP